MIIFFDATMVLLYYLVFILYYQFLFPIKRHRVPQILMILTLLITYVCLNTWSLSILNFPAVMVIMIVGLRFSTRMKWNQAAYAGATCVITAYCFRGIFNAISGFLYKRYAFFSNTYTYYVITLFALPASLLFLSVLRRTLFPDIKIKQFLNNSSQLKLAIIYVMAAAIDLFVINTGRYLSPNWNWYMEIALGTCTLTLFMLIYAIHQSIRSTELLEYQWRTKALEDQYYRQLQHYNSYQKYTESFRAFRHDYKFMMGTLKSLIRLNDIENAVQLLDDIYDDIQKKVLIHQKYSNNVALDAMLQDLANICAGKEIRFSFNAFAPRNTNLTLLDSIRIFSNITNNAVEACEKVPVSERFIKITSRNDQQWVTLEVINSYDGQVTVKKGTLITTKSDKYSHGLGLGIVQEIVENMGGFVIYDTALENKTFLTRVHVPYVQNKSS